MRRANTLTALPTEKWQLACLCEWLAACCAFHNEVNYRRRHAHFDGNSWKSATYTDLYDDYAAVVSKAGCQQLVQKNADAWRSFDELDAKYGRGDLDDEPSPPGYWGNRRDGYELKSVVRNDLYQIEWNADQSTIKIPVGKALNEKYDIPGRGYLVELEFRGDPRWKGKQCRLDIAFDETSQCFRVNQPVTVQPDYLDVVRQADFPHPHSHSSEHTDDTDETRSAAIDVGANNTLSIVTTDGDARIYHARPQFEQFREDYEEIATLQSLLPPFVSSSDRIRRRFDELYGHRDHHRDAAVKDAAQWLVSKEISEVIVGDLSDVLSTHWSARVNQKNHNFWSHGQLIDRLDDTFAVAGLSLSEVSEAGSSSTCPYCESNEVTRHGDSFSCDDCPVESHADIVGAAMLLAENAETAISEWFAPRSEQDGSMARPDSARSAGRLRDGDQFEVTYLQWDAHEWTPVSTRPVGTLGVLHQRGFSEPASSVGRDLAVSP